MKNVHDETLGLFVDTCHKIAERGLLRCSCGNLSLRLDEERFLITGTGSWMNRLRREDAVVCRISDGVVLDGKKPSSEAGFHAGTLRVRPNVNAVLHFQSPYATALACRRGDAIDYAVIPEIPYYIGSIARVPYLRPGSTELAEAVTEAMRNHDMALLANHGQVTAARDLDQAIQNAEFFELACQILWIGGNAVAAMPPEESEHLRRLRAERSARAV
ncbi:MAG: hypothetical protein A2W18_00045 [Candidatus Muproteobacteria bacterium RBG_16_60_9]|uniref:Class II aldolase/adducin N-terminal domain-containing protein n=1 Tax=Candidatus Muproteobacteria bacterium RBG_16_60_9 TaxID=1817755 RepID=A0A1F6VJG2_9PROT|nr:MAG: hypothetical protein A2W18_00045 [Candidatus Muproteobacteria bacterium RBG_16_60_9]